MWQGSIRIQLITVGDCVSAVAGTLLRTTAEPCCWRMSCCSNNGAAAPASPIRPRHRRGRMVKAAAPTAHAAALLCRIYSRYQRSSARRGGFAAGPAPGAAVPQVSSVQGGGRMGMKINSVYAYSSCLRIYNKSWKGKQLFVVVVYNCEKNMI